MPLVYKLPISSSLSSASTKQFNPINPKSILCSLNFNAPSSASASASGSPFTEKHSVERYQRDQWIYNNLQKNRQEPICSVSLDEDSIRRNDIALQLPELKKLFWVLREKRKEKCGDGKGEKCALGNVYLVGTGPGDPELLTLKAMRVIQKADLLLYDRLISKDVLDLVGPSARLLYVGKTAGYHSRTQVFGRGGEEMDFLQQQGIQMKVIPGITAASGIAVELGIPLTHRGVANSVRFLTGHSRKSGTDPLFVAENAADPDSTLVVYVVIHSPVSCPEVDASWSATQYSSCCN